MFAARNGIAYGISFNPEEHSELYLWAENRTDQPANLIFCCVSTLLEQIVIYNSDGHLVPSKSDELARKAHSEGREVVQVCTCSGSVTVPALTIQLFVSADISYGYTLGPGRYIVAERKSEENQDLTHVPRGLELSLP
jgi:hypothetical protein